MENHFFDLILRLCSSSSVVIYVSIWNPIGFFVLILATVWVLCDIVFLLRQQPVQSVFFTGQGYLIFTLLSPVASWGFGSHRISSAFSSAELLRSFQFSYRTLPRSFFSPSPVRRSLCRVPFCVLPGRTQARVLPAHDLSRRQVSVLILVSQYRVYSIVACSCGLSFGPAIWTKAARARVPAWV
jgi:hypothetical protein